MTPIFFTPPHFRDPFFLPLSLIIQKTAASFHSAQTSTPTSTHPPEQQSYLPN